MGDKFMDLNNILVKAAGDYPQIVDATDDNLTVAILKDLAFSKQGELGAVLTYIFQSTIADKSNSELGELFEEIAITEMAHLGLLMHAITAFGGLPKYETGNGVPFNVNWVNYSTKLKDMLEQNIRGEQIGIDNYNQAIKMVKNQSLKDLFARIILDEQKHIEAQKQVQATVQFLSI